LALNRINEVEDFIDFLSQGDSDRQLTQAATAASEPTLNAVWDNTTEWTYLGKSRFVQIGFPGSDECRRSKGIPEDRIEMRLQARIGLQYPTDAVTLLLDGRLLAPSTPLGLVLPLQQISQEDNQPTFECSPFAFPHRFDLLGNMLPVHFIKAVGTNQLRIPQCPGVSALLNISDKEVADMVSSAPLENSPLPNSSEALPQTDES